MADILEFKQPEPEKKLEDQCGYFDIDFLNGYLNRVIAGMGEDSTNRHIGEKHE